MLSEMAVLLRSKYSEMLFSVLRKSKKVNKANFVCEHSLRDFAL